MRVFLDTNVLVSALATRGLCSELLETVINEHELLIGDPVLKELRRVLADKLRLPKPLIASFEDLLKTEGQIIVTEGTLALSVVDVDDIPILACAVFAHADVVVTGDKALLELRSIGEIPILSPRQLWQKLSGLEGQDS